MTSTSFYLDKCNGRELIRSNDSELEVKIYRLDKEPFRASKEKLTFYAGNGHKVLALEADAGTDLTGALTWYTNHADIPLHSLSLNDPRPVALLYLVK